MENEEKPTKVNGVSAQINLGVGSPTHLRFARLMTDAGSTSARDFCNVLMDAYENPASDEQTAQDLNNLHETIKKRDEEIGSYQKALKDKEAEIEQLKASLEEANRVANENAESGLGNQLKLEEFQRSMAGAIVIKPNPVVAYFLEEMSKRTGMEPGKILEKLFLDDLQNPRSNNLPYTVTSSEIRRVMNELKSGKE